MKRSGKIASICVVLLICNVLNVIVSAQQENGTSAETNRQILARQAGFKALLKSIRSRNGQVVEPCEPALLHRTSERYIRFLSMPRSSHIEVSKPTNWTPDNVSDTFVQEWKALLTQDIPSVEFRRKVSLHRKGYTIVQYGQAFSGLDVHGASIVIQVNNSGGIDAINSDVMRDVSVFETNQVSLEPTIDQSAARTKGLAWMNNDWQRRYRSSADLRLDASPARLMIFAPSVVGKQGSPRLVWQFEISSYAASIHEYVLIDAHNGEVAHHYSLIDYALPPNANRQIFDSNNTNSIPTDPNLAARTEGQGAIGDDFIDDLYTYLGWSLDFFWEEHQKDSWDGASYPIRAYARFYEPPGFPKDYAYFSHRSGDPAVYIGEWALAADLVAHEYTHGVMYYMKDLDGYGESGAINESLADSWGEWIAQTYDSSNNVAWELYDQAYFVTLQQFQKPWRVMDDPPSVNTHSSYGQAFGNIPQPDIYLGTGWYTGGDDHGGVHHNLGVGNKLCYLLTDGGSHNGHSVSGFNMSKTAGLYYTCIDLLPTACEYYDLYFALVQAATNEDFSWNDRVNVKEACEAVGIVPDSEEDDWTLESHWKLDETSGSVASDSAGGNDGSVTGAVWVAGKVGNALSFDGTNDYVSMSSVDALTGRSVTVAAWVKPASLSGYSSIVSQYLYQYSSFNGYDLYLDGNGYPAFALDDFIAKSPSSISTDQWYHIAGTFNGLELRIYVDGQEEDIEDDEDLSGVSGEDRMAYIGFSVSGASYYFHGLIDDVRVYNYALDEDEIAMLGDVTPPTPDPVTWAVYPHGTWKTTISMTATTASDPSGVEYYFKGFYGPGHDSGWQDSPTYQDSGLAPDSFCCYTVKARDKSTQHNETGESSPACGRSYCDFPEACPSYNDWVAFGHPRCWCGSGRQCHGDADGEQQGNQKTGYYYVGTNDLNILLDAWQVKEPPFGPGILSVSDGICADFDRAQQGNPKTGYMRVGTEDLNILIGNWLVLEPPDGDGISPDCLQCGRGQQMGGGEVDFKKITKWIETIWQDPEIQKAINMDAWIRLVKSIAEYMEEASFNTEP